MTATEKFEAFHEANPQVYRTLVSMTREMHSRGRKPIGMKMLFEVFRWNYYKMTSDPTSDFKINNNYTPFYARKIMDEHKDLDGMFEIREQHTL